MERHLATYRRDYVNAGSGFFTVNVKNRRCFLLTAQIEALRQAVNTIRQRKPFHIDAWVVLPEHIHCVWTLPANDTDYSGRWREIKKQFTRTLQLRDIWQPRFREHTLRDEVDYRHPLDYVYNNPVKHGWVTQVRDWPFSTFHRDVRRGLYPEEWGSETVDSEAGERR